MNNIYAICDVRLIEPYTQALTTLYSVGIIKGWRMLKASTNDDYAQIAIPYDLYKEYYSSAPVKGKIIEPIPGTGKVIDHMIVIDIKDLGI